MSAQGNLLRKKCISGIRIVSATRLIPNHYDLGYYESVSATRLIPNYYDLGYYESVSVTRLIPIHYDLGYQESVSEWVVTRGYQV